MPAVPMPYQEEGILEIEDFGGRALLADEMGLGKTLQALWWLQRHPEAWPAVVVCPASLKYNWEHEALVNIGVRASVLEGINPPQRTPIGGEHLYILNYDILAPRKGKVIKSDGWIDWLRQMEIQTVVLDEAHRLGNPSANQTKATIKLCKHVPHILALSGTPLTKRPRDLYPVLHLIRPDIFKSFFSFGQEYCKPRYTPWGWEYNGATNLKQLHSLLKRTCMVRRLKKDVLTQLPSKMRKMLPIPMDTPEEYQKAKTDFIKWLAGIDAAKARKAKKAETVTKVSYLRQLAAKLKARAAVTWINEFIEENPDEKLVIFAIHKQMIKLLQKHVKAKSVVIDGSVTGRDRQNAVLQFQTEESTRVCIGNIFAAGVGLTLTASSTVIVVELPWNPGDLIQAEDRVHRIGQMKVAWIYYLVAHGTIEERLCQILQDKQEVLKATLDGEAEEIDLDIMDMLLGTGGGHV